MRRRGSAGSRKGWSLPKAILPVVASLLFGLSFAAVPGATTAIQPRPDGGEQVVTAGVYLSPPFVQRDGAGYSGMAIELWEEIAARRGLATRYEVYPTFRDLMEAVQKGRADIAVTNLTITRDRAKVLSFTQPWYDAGLRIMVSDAPSGKGFAALVEGLGRSGHLRAYAWLAGIIVVATILVTLVDRKFDKDFPRRWRDGIAESFYHVMSVATAGKTSRKNLFGWAGRIWSGIWLACGLAVLAYVTSSITSVMTTLSLTRQINSISDLPGKTVGVLVGSTGEEYARQRGLKARAYDDIEHAVVGLANHEVDAIVGDAPVLEYYAHLHPGEPVSVVGDTFHPDKYGFALRSDSQLTHPLTVEILGLQESGRVRELRVKYFGE